MKAQHRIAVCQWTLPSCPRTGQDSPGCLGAPPARCVALKQQRTPQSFTRVVQVRNLPRCVSEAEALKKFFADCGEVADICVGA
jgi:hypothetical protein